jgi:hypothetical protein
MDILLCIETLFEISQQIGVDIASNQSGAGRPTDHFFRVALTGLHQDLIGLAGGFLIHAAQGRDSQDSVFGFG